MNRTVLLLIAVVVIIGVGGAAALFLLNNDTTPQSDLTPGVENTQGPSVPTSTPAPTNTEIPFTAVVIAIQDIPRGIEIQPNMVTVIRFPAESAPAGAFANIEDVVGLIASTDIVREEIVIARKLVQDFNSLGRVGSDAAAVLDPGRVAITLPMDVFTSVGYALQPGDRVDVIVSMLFVDVDQDFQTILPNNFQFVTTQLDPETGQVTIAAVPGGAGQLDTRSLFLSSSGGGGAGSTSTTLSVLVEPNPGDARQRPRLVTQRTVTDAEVIWVGEFPQDGRIFRPAATPTPVATATPEGTVAEEGEETAPVATPVPPRPQIVTLGVRPQDAVVLTYMAEAQLPITFALRSARTQGLPDTAPVTLSYLLSTYNITVPDRFDFAVEPAIESIRQLSLGDRIQLGGNTAAPAPEGADN